MDPGIIAVFAMSTLPMLGLGALRVAAPSLPPAAAVPGLMRDLATLAAEIEARVHPVVTGPYH